MLHHNIRQQYDSQRSGVNQAIGDEISLRIGHHLRETRSHLTREAGIKVTQPPTLERRAESKRRAPSKADENIKKAKHYK